MHRPQDLRAQRDQRAQAKKNGAENLALVRKIALNMLQNVPARGKRNSITAKRQSATRSVDYLRTVLTSGTLGN